MNPSLDINQYAHSRWTIREGFFKGTIGSIAQTPDGYLWLGTEFGLLRFDGVRSVVWQAPADDNLPSSSIRCLLVSRDGRLWIGTSKGLASWEGGKLTHYPKLAGQDVLALLEDREGTVWAGGFALAAGKLCAMRPTGAECYGEDGSLGQGVLSLYEDKKGNFWAGTMRGLWRWKPGSPKLYAIPDYPYSTIEGDNGILWIASPAGIKQLLDGKTEAYQLPGAVRRFRPSHLFRDRDGGLWIGTTDRGLLHVHHGRTDSFARSDGLSGDFINAVFEDREGDIWTATTDGLDRFRDFAIPTVSATQGLSNATVVSVLAARDGSVWLGTVDGLNRWKDGEATIFRKRNGLPDDAVHSLFQDNSGRIWVSTLPGIVSGVALILDIDLKLREQPSVADEVSIL